MRTFFKQAAKYCSVYDIKELNQLESIFLKAIDYRLRVEQEELDRYITLMSERAQELQCKQFRKYVTDYQIIDNYFAPPEPVTYSNELSHFKLPPVFLNGKLFKDSEEVYSFFH